MTFTASPPSPAPPSRTVPPEDLSLRDPCDRALGTAIAPASDPTPPLDSPVILPPGAVALVDLSRAPRVDLGLEPTEIARSPLPLPPLLLEPLPPDSMALDPIPTPPNPPPLDLVILDPVPLDTVPLDTVPLDTVPLPLDTVPLDMVPLDTVPLELAPAPASHPGIPESVTADLPALDRETVDPTGDRSSLEAARDPEPESPEVTIDLKTLDLAADDVRRVMKAQDDQGQTLTTKLNILFVTNGALLTSVSISRLMAMPSRFSLGFNVLEVLGFLLSFTLLISAFFPRQVVVSPNLQDQKFLERYLLLSADEYQLQMLVNLIETYNANRQRLDDVSLSLRYAAYATWIIAALILSHMVVAYSFS